MALWKYLGLLDIWVLNEALGAPAKAVLESLVAPSRPSEALQGSSRYRHLGTCWGSLGLFRNHAHVGRNHAHVGKNLVYKNIRLRFVHNSRTL